jgi:hypothetical protein
MVNQIGFDISDSPFRRFFFVVSLILPVSDSPIHFALDRRFSPSPILRFDSGN